MAGTNNPYSIDAGEYRAVIDAAVEGIIKINAIGNIEIFNNAAQKLFGYSEKEICGKNIGMLMQDASAGIFNEYFNIQALGNPLTIGRDTEILAKHQNGQIFPVEMRISYIEYNGMHFFTASIWDITELKKSEERINQYADRMEWAYFEMQSARSEATRANQAKTLFLANIGHEIRTPLNGILGMAELLYNTELTEKQEKFTNNIYNSGEMLLELINNILDFSKIEANGMRLELLPTNLHKIIEDVVGIFIHEIQAKGIKIRINIEENIPQQISIDPVRLKQILINLIGNAVKFTKKGHINISVAKTRILKDKIRLRFEIKDTGIGIPRDKQNNIFEKFEQADFSTTRKYGGTGLGLTICKQLVEDLMKGHIGVESEINQGSLFWFEITCQ